MKLINRIFSAFERNNKKLMINSSGSTPDSSWEKIRSGQSYLYQKSGMNSEIFEITFYKKVYGGILNQALTEALKRYPYLNTKLIELDGDFYIVQNQINLTAKRTKALARLGHISCGYHLVDITYYGKNVYVSWHHALCDGKGIKHFIETLIYYYCKIRFNSVASDDGIRLSDSPLLPDEATEPNLSGYSYDEKRAEVNVSRDAFAIPENVIEEHETDYRYDVQVAVEQFMKACKQVNATPVILTSLLVSSGIAKLYPDFDKPINANVAVDIRNALDLPYTFKNCVRSMPLPYTKEMTTMSLFKQAKIQRDLLDAQRNRDNLRKLANASLGLFEKLDSLPDYASKQGMMEFFDSMLINTYVISYLGQMVLNENAKYIDKMCFYNSGAAGLGVNIISCGEKLCFNFKQSFKSDKYVKAFLAGLDRLGITYKASDAIAFTTPNDSIIKRKTVKN
ncbi:MAG: hypothetical protein ACI4WG_05020 [Erysipelotrichaceae bacterium]